MLRISDFASPSSGTKAKAQLVVPRSIPMLKRDVGILAWYRLLRPDLEFDLPSAIRINVLHPQFKRAHFSHDGVDLHRNDVPRREIRERRQVDLEQARFLQLTFGIRQDLSRSVAASHRRRVEPEFGGVPGEKTELSPFDE